MRGRRALILLATCAGAGVAPASALAYPLCQNELPATGSGSYQLGRINSQGYAGGQVGGIDLTAIDQITPANAPKVFASGPGGSVQTLEVAGGLVSLSYPGLQNTLAGVTPTTNVETSAFPLNTGETSFAGAHTLNVIFNGRVTIYPPSTFFCQSVSQPNTYWRLTIPEVKLDGYGTSVQTGLEPFGTGLNIGISPGDTSNM